MCEQYESVQFEGWDHEAMLAELARLRARVAELEWPAAETGRLLLKNADMLLELARLRARVAELEGQANKLMSIVSTAHAAGCLAMAHPNVREDELRRAVETLEKAIGVTVSPDA